LCYFQVKLIGAENVNWETFVYDLHPYRDPTRLELIKDDSPFQTEARRKAEDKNHPELASSTPPAYKPDVFRLTETRPSPSPKE